MKSILNQVDQPKDLKKLNIDQLNQLSKEIREYLIDVVSETGGHLSSNLGVVELTVGLHYVFNSPYDQMVWDVGHQSYVHKILTGRKEALKTVRQYGGLSGFTKRCESDHDTFDVGHSSTSISAALGFAVARDIHKEGNSVVAIIGDGALTAGMAYEALNNGASMHSNFIVILNDNQMSIAPNVGGMAKYLDKIRTGSVYKEIKTDMHKILDKVPLVGKGLTKAIKDLKDGLKQMMIPGMFFEEMGYTYLGPLDGHNVHEVVTVLRQAKRIDGPVLIHLKTVKGKGYHHAEKDPSKYHGIKPFITESGKAKSKQADNQGQSYGEILGDKLTEYVKNDYPVVGITAAMPSGTGLTSFAKQCPKAFFDVGIAEQHAVTFAAGMGLKGIKPYVAIYSSFLQRAYDQVLHDVCIQKVPVVFVLDRAGIVGEDGETHQGVFDYSYLNHMPNMTIMAPRDNQMFKNMMDYSRDFTRGPLTIRYPKGPAVNLDYKPGEIIHGKGTVLKHGSKVAILAVGSMVEIALQVADRMNREITVADGVFIKPFDYKLVRKLSESHDYLFVLEENSMIGGYGSMITSCANEENLDMRIYTRGIKDQFVPHGSRAQLLDDVGLSTDKIIEFIEEKVITWQ